MQNPRSTWIEESKEVERSSMQLQNLQKMVQNDYGLKYQTHGAVKWKRGMLRCSLSLNGERKNKKKQRQKFKNRVEPCDCLTF